MITDEELREYAESVRGDVTVPPMASVRTRARRRRRRAVSATAAAVILVSAGVVVPIALLHNGSEGGRRTQVVISSPSPTPSTPVKYPLPPLGAAGFPASVYPLAHRGLVPGAVATCPSVAGLQLPTSGTRNPAVRIVTHLEARSFRADLIATDRAYWPQIRRDWRDRRAWATPVAPRKAGQGHILHTGMLAGPWPSLGVPNPAPWVRRSCGQATLRDSFVVAYGVSKNPNVGGALQGVSVFVVRAGKALLYFTY